MDTAIGNNWALVISLLSAVTVLGGLVMLKVKGIGNSVSSTKTDTKAGNVEINLGGGAGAGMQKDHACDHGECPQVTEHTLILNRLSSVQERQAQLDERMLVLLEMFGKDLHDVREKVGELVVTGRTRAKGR